MHKEACIIAGTRMGGRPVLFKNRDRAYDANLRVHRMEWKGTEVAFVLDLDSGYLEGLNEHGLGIVNTALMVLDDEKEGKKKGPPTKSKDGPKIFRALAERTLPEALRALLKDPIKGHTFICQGDQLVCIEASRTHKPRVGLLSMDRVNTRTNHGIAYPDAGYTKGDDYVSSVIRRWETQKRFQGLDAPEDMARALYEKRIHEKGSPYNPVRDTEKMRTTNQVMFDLAGPALYLYLIPGHSTFHGVVNRLDREPKIKLYVQQYRG